MEATEDLEEAGRRRTHDLWRELGGCAYLLKVDLLSIWFPQR